MISSVNTLSSSAISVLFGTTSATETTQTDSAAEKLLDQATGNTDDVFKAGNAIGKIIEIVAGMNSSDTGLFTMDGAERIDGSDGEYSLTKTGAGKVVSDEQLVKSDIDIMRQQAAGTGPEAERAQAYLKALSDGSMQKIDLSAQGVSATMTQTDYYYADGTQKGSSTSYAVKGLNEFLKANTFVAEDGTLRDKATGKYAGIEQNGTKFSYAIY